MTRIDSASRWDRHGKWEPYHASRIVMGEDATTPPGACAPDSVWCSSGPKFSLGPEFYGVPVIPAAGVLVLLAVIL